MKKHSGLLIRITAAAAAMIIGMSTASVYADSAELPRFGTITVQTNPVTVTDEYGRESEIYRPQVDLGGHSSAAYSWYDDKYTWIYLLFKAEPTFDEKGKVTAIKYYCRDKQKTVPDFDKYFNVASDNSITPKDKLTDEDGNFSQEALAWIKQYHRSLASVYNYSADGIPFNSDSSMYIRDSSSPGNPWAELEKDDEGKYTGKIIFRNLPFGYYYIDSNVGAAAIINTTAPDAEIVDKNEHPELVKTITQITNADGKITNPDPEKEGKSLDIQPGHTDEVDPSGNNRPAHAATVQIGDTVQYTIHVTAKKGAGYYRLSDTIYKGLTLDQSSVTLQVENKDGSKTDLGTENYTKTVNASNNDTTINISFEQAYLDTIKEDTELYLVYNCTVNQNVSVAWDAGAYSMDYWGYGPNKNTVSLSYGRTGYTMDQNRIYSARLNIYKYEGDGVSSTAAGNRGLAGVKFVLKNEKGQYLKQGADKVIHWVDELSDECVLVTGGNPSFKPETTTEEINFSIPGISRFEGPFKGTDQTSGTADDYYKQLSEYGMLSVVIGKDLEFGTADDEVTFVPWREPFVVSYSPGKDGEWGTADEVATTQTRDPEAGIIRIDGLTNGKYTLVETEPLPGYSKADDVVITINNQNNTFEELKYQVNIKNQIGSVLPSTGGSGTTIFYVIGTIMLLGAGVALNEKRRKRAA